ncbi:MAG TPA: ABC transporter ATP-binding protein [Deltaproteobacteria bacterium]|nr:ABC transporter ATP-binding protein [Candidatus Lambdaproteobacteria bacterium]HIN47986.1 ABC transporter ATP-binding protein [Deltaproteobacteria bacterium]
MTSLAIELTEINKNFGEVCANKNVSLKIESGTIHGIIGENGAGKSTLMSILYGFYQADSGEIAVKEKPTVIRSAHDAILAGIGMVHQHFMLIDTFTVLENVVLGTETGFSLKESMQASARELRRIEKDYHLEVDINAVINTLPVGLQQRVEILKALYRGAEILILDEPTGVLTPQEADHLFRILDELREQGKTVIFITHKLREIMAITDNVSVMRQGEMVAHRSTSQTNREELAELMVGRKVLLRVEKAPAKTGRMELKVEHLNVTDDSGVHRVKDVCFEVHSGEIVGIAGVSGNGQSELMDAITGIKPLQNGQIQINDETITPALSADAAAMRRFGMAHVPEDRQRRGLVTSFSANENIILGYHKDPAYNGFIEMDRNAIIQSCKKQMKHFDVRPGNPFLRTSLFSGGNQQKLVVARELERDPSLLVVGQPTRGVDIGAIEFIHRQIIAMRDAGKAVLLISVELDEILSLSDRILVMFDGQIMGEILAKDANEREIGLLMAGVRKEAA